MIFLLAWLLSIATLAGIFGYLLGNRPTRPPSDLKCCLRALAHLSEEHRGQRDAGKGTR